MVLVMPAINDSGNQYQDCVNGPSARDETNINTDVRADVLARYRVSRNPYEWGLTGYSSGGYCAASLALRHRRSYGAAAALVWLWQQLAPPDLRVPFSVGAAARKPVFTLPVKPVPAHQAADPPSPT